MRFSADGKKIELTNAEKLVCQTSLAAQKSLEKTRKASKREYAASQAQIELLRPLREKLGL